MNFVKNFSGVLFGLCALFFAGISNACTTLPGVNSLVSNQKTLFLVVGDYHGTNEVPLLFLDIMCHAIAAGRSISVALEWPDNISMQINQFLQSDGGNSSREALFNALGSAQSDGRGSLAMLNLIEEIRKHNANKLPIPVIPMQPTSALKGSEYEKKMAEIILLGRANLKSNLTLIFVGGAHAMRKSHPLNPNVNPMATYLPADEVLTVNSAEYLGRAWNCQRPSSDGKLVCGERILKTGEANPRGVALMENDTDQYHARFTVGAPFTASKPAFP